MYTMTDWDPQRVSWFMVVERSFFKGGKRKSGKGKGENEGMRDYIILYRIKNNYTT
jgi:hypothetical protein